MSKNDIKEMKCLNSDQTKISSPNVRKVFIQRDYGEGTDVRFQKKFPQELEEYIDRQSFEYLIDTLNSIYADAETMSGRICLESCFACFTAYLTYICCDTYYDKCLRKISAFIAEQNDTVWKPRNLYVTDPIERGLRVIEIAIIEPNGEQMHTNTGNTNYNSVTNNRNP
ncbi:golgin subfamily A member 7-like [Oppia nitens]|uniref:golgin subfamily A member 7-like n=1 Tax=Oppia nitens TaxID=1686743 RepID=UPI0023DC03F5|nr:golgin subfamily A member 7-like [Oppia nitens]